MVSVIVPVYNGEEFIDECLHSIMGQTYPDLEILVIDDGSTDGSLALCRGLSDTELRIRLFHQENAGVSAARNHGLREARGEYVIFVDADDALLPTAVETLLKAAQSGADFVIGSYEIFRAGAARQVIREPMALALPFTEETEKLEDLVSQIWGRLYKRSVIEENRIRFPEGIPYGEDTIFNLHYCQYARKAAALGDVVCRRRLGGMASSLRYYPNRGELAAALIEAYCAYFGGREKIPAPVLKRVAENELTDTIAHYLIHCGLGEAWDRTEDTLSRLRPYLPETGGLGDGKSRMKRVLRAQWLRILYRKLRKRVKGKLASL